MRNFFVDDALGVHAGLPGVREPGFDRNPVCLLDIRIGQYDKRIRTAKFQYLLFQGSAGASGHGAAYLSGTRERHGRYPVICDYGTHPFGFDEDGSAKAWGQARLVENILDGRRRPGNIVGVLENCPIAGGECREDEAEELPQRIVPGHNR
ncbi:hypothetical protein [Arthrobacter sp. StoSoilB5]|uniref:hypothetical protein n=1 Tax=Arthrobacter sp. StoSoilB5 TaxID=2830992 RepID=UPI001E7D939B|nr:hypothetical protein [Arthrobacter sp. StoSoilB5]BCW45072.1 hypothetical protein StoSoilB5_22560 [Arthrobacter sp. StoSoilB5]